MSMESLRSIRVRLRRLLKWDTLAIANVVLLICLLVLLARVNILAGLRNIPPTVVTLLVALVTFSGVAWQTNRGFRNLIASQEHRAKIGAIAKSW
ncbi:MAG: hypothetical protein F9K29_03610 [Hyphomicrobiaceae bacterium]|nr:MAG: hypothetical protein F9K29_03610 [Hyphomicrobiaceae bacterium]